MAEEEAGARTIHDRMIAILDELPAIAKSRENTQQHFMFRGHDDVLNELNPLLAKHGVYVLPDVLERIAEKRATAGGKVMYEVNLHVRFRFYGAGGDHVEASGWGEGTDMGDKATSKAMTMAFKYVLFEVFAISTQDASDSDASAPEETVTVAVADEEAVDALRSLLLEEGISESTIEDKFNIARQANRGELHPEYVSEQTAKALERKKAREREPATA